MISVCMAVYNGELYLHEQLTSILIQLAAEDEVIVVDDCSHDHSVQIIQSLNDPRIQLTINKKNLGPSASFEKALLRATGRHIYLSDQDDIWLPRKVEIMTKMLDSGHSLVVVSDARVVTANRNVIMESLFALRGSRPGFWHNLYKNGFVGCCMAIRSDALSFLLPFPKHAGLHDEWIGLSCSLAGRVDFCDEILIEYRRHEGNATQLSHGTIYSMIAKRISLLVIVFARLPQIFRLRHQTRFQ